MADPSVPAVAEGLAVVADFAAAVAAVAAEAA